jgi:hypothetical protein
MLSLGQRPRASWLARWHWCPEVAARVCSRSQTNSVQSGRLDRSVRMGKPFFRNGCHPMVWWFTRRPIGAACSIRNHLARDAQRQDWRGLWLEGPHHRRHGDAVVPNPRSLHGCPRRRVDDRSLVPVCYDNPNAGPSALSKRPNASRRAWVFPPSPTRAVWRPRVPLPAP